MIDFWLYSSHPIKIANNYPRKLPLGSNAIEKKIQLTKFIFRVDCIIAQAKFSLFMISSEKRQRESEKKLNERCTYSKKTQWHVIISTNSYGFKWDKRPAIIRYGGWKCVWVRATFALIKIKCWFSWNTEHSVFDNFFQVSIIRKYIFLHFTWSAK